MGVMPHGLKELQDLLDVIACLDKLLALRAAKVMVPVMQGSSMQLPVLHSFSPCLLLC